MLIFNFFCKEESFVRFCNAIISTFGSTLLDKYGDTYSKFFIKKIFPMIVSSLRN
jgi:hypothetical protein